MYTEVELMGNKQHRIGVKVWDQVEEPKGVVQLFHGMAEHIKRYDDFASFLNKNGYIVVGHDHRGHGDSLGQPPIYGYLGQDGFSNVVEDGYLVTKFIKDSFSEFPLYLFAHSFGSFVAQRYMTKYGDQISGVILSGSAKQTGALIDLARLLARAQSLFMKETKEAVLLDKLSFGAFNKKVTQPKTPFDWLSRDDEQVQKYILDPLCGYVSTLNFYKAFLSGLKEVYKDEHLDKIPKDLPLMILSGDKDPVGGYSKSVIALKDQYERLKLTSVQLKLYKEGRHEMLNEINRLQVYEDILKWLNDNNAI